MINFIKSLFGRKEPVKVSSRPLTDDEFNDMKSKRQAKLNSILDKISKNGIDSLSIHEKNFLDNYEKIS